MCCATYPCPHCSRPLDDGRDLIPKLHDIYLCRRCHGVLPRDLAEAVLTTPAKRASLSCTSKPPTPTPQQEND